jgi:ABC-2 type transport system permease protein
MSAVTAPQPSTRPGRAFKRLIATELKLFLREPMLAFWGLIFPIALLVILGAAGSNKPNHSLGGLRLIVVYTPVVMMFTLTILSISSLPAALASYRDKGYLRRLSTTPVGAVRLLAAQILITLCLAVSVVILILVVAKLAFSVAFPRDLGGFALAVLLIAAAMLSLGTLIAAVAPSQRLAGVIGSLLFFPLMFFAGLWVPQATMSPALRTISRYTPLGAGDPAVQNSLAGHWPGTSHLLVLIGYTVVLCVAAARLFRWER